MASISAELAYRWLGHAGHPKRKATEKDLGIEIDNDNHSFHCAACKLRKSKKIISRIPQTRATRPGQMIHADLQQVCPTVIGGYNYALVMADDATRYRFIRLLKHKNEASDKMKKFALQIKNNTDAYPQEWRIDGGTEFNHFNIWATANGQWVEPSAPYCHEQNGLSEMSSGYLM
ncbi:hypothetical protein N7540_000177 [Penicillium herquei]|nr:hypothetical protein N7540_000177 [Penicillium herquei]